MTGMIRGIALLGITIFGSLLFLLGQYPKDFERSAVGFMKHRIEIEIRERYPEFGNGRLEQGVRQLSEKLGLRQENLRRSIDSDLPDFIAAVVAGYCGCMERVDAKAEAIRDSLRNRIARLDVTRERLSEVIKGKYDNILAALRRDLTIFLGTNLVAFAVVLAASFLRRESSRLILLPTSLLEVQKPGIRSIFSGERSD